MVFVKQISDAEVGRQYLVAAQSPAVTRTKVDQPVAVDVYPVGIVRDHVAHILGFQGGKVTCVLAACPVPGELVDPGCLRKPGQTVAVQVTTGNLVELVACQGQGGIELQTRRGLPS